jgi:tetratricopeptide (TPR) repeat protein
MMIKNIKILLFIILLGTSLIAKNGTLDTEVLLDANGDGKKDLINYVVVSTRDDVKGPYIKIDIKTDKKIYSYKAVWIMYPVIRSCGKGCIEISDIRGKGEFFDIEKYKYYKKYDDWLRQDECNTNTLCYFSNLNELKIPRDSLVEFEKKLSLIEDEYLSYTVTNEYLKKYLNKYPLTEKTVTQYNNIAYYLQKQGLNNEAIYLLEIILEKYPNRVVAHYNIADAYWAIGKKEKAIKHYKIYIELMKQKGKEKEIPKEVLDRVVLL